MGSFNPGAEPSGRAQGLQRPWAVGAHLSEQGTRAAP